MESAGSSAGFDFFLAVGYIFPVLMAAVFSMGSQVSLFHLYRVRKGV